MIESTPATTRMGYRAKVSRPSTIPPASTYVSEYIDRLPQGLESHPGIRTKGSVIRSFVSGLDLVAMKAALPSELHEYLDPNLPSSLWVPDAKANAVFLAIRDALCLDDAAYVRHAYERNRDYLRGPFFAAILRLLNPERLMRNFERAWGHAHQGLPLMLQMSRDGDQTIASATLTYPMHLTPSLVVEGYVTAWRAVLVHHERRGAECKLASYSPTRSVLEARWS